MATYDEGAELNDVLLLRFNVPTLSRKEKEVDDREGDDSAFLCEIPPGGSSTRTCCSLSLLLCMSFTDSQSLSSEAILSHVLYNHNR